MSQLATGRAERAKPEDDPLAGQLYDAWRIWPSLRWAEIRAREIATDRMDETGLFLLRWGKVADAARQALQR